MVIRGTTAVPVLYLDIDGTVRKSIDHLGHFVRGPWDVEIFPEAMVQMRKWKAAGGRIAGVSNQGGIALGYVSYETVAASMRETNRKCDDMFDVITFCQHHPASPNPDNQSCWCRKPLLGAVARAAGRLESQYPNEQYPARLSLFVGDRPEDKQCAETAGIAFRWAEEWRQEVTATTATRGEIVADIIAGVTEGS